MENPGIGNEPFTIKLDSDWIGSKGDGTVKCRITSEAKSEYTSCIARLLCKLTGGRRYVTAYWYDIETVDEEENFELIAHV